MGRYLDLDDVAATSDLAMQELAELRAEIARLRAELESARVDAERLSSAMRGASVIGRSELSMMMNALRRDADDRPCRGEMVEEAERSINKYAAAIDAARGKDNG